MYNITYSYLFSINMQQNRSAYNMRNAHSAYSTYSAHNTGLSHLEQEMLIKSFPNEIKFSYEKSTHKKVLSDLYVIIPKGRKYFVWFTHHNRKNICLFLEICNRTHNILNVFYRYVSFHDTLSYGTIFYGTLFRQGQDDIFSVENIYYYKGQSIQDYTYESKLKTIKDIFDTGLRYNTRFQFHPSQKSVVFGIPVIATSFDEACKVAEKLPYAVYSIQYRHLKTSDANEYYLFGSSGGERSDRVERSERKDRNDNNIKIEIIEKPVITQKVEIIEKVEVKKKPLHTSANANANANASANANTNTNTRLFYIKPDLQNDIYYLYDIKSYTLSSLENSSIISKNIAHIPDYKTSVLMNKLFRNIKENRNLDALEESDEEEEFENIQIDKFVDLNKVLKMRCNFNYKFQAWVPVQVVE